MSGRRDNLKTLGQKRPVAPIAAINRITAICFSCRLRWFTQKTLKIEGALGILESNRGQCILTSRCVVGFRMKKIDAGVGAACTVMWPF